MAHEQRPQVSNEPVPDPADVWEKIDATFPEDAVALLHRLSEKGPGAFRVIRSAEAVPLGLIAKNPTRFKPRR